MKTYYYCFAHSAAVLLLLAPAWAALAQASVITGVAPLANARAAARTAPLVVSFNVAPAAGAANALQVFSQQRGGRRTSTVPATAGTNTLTFSPGALPYLPGETVQYSVLAGAAGSGGSQSPARVGQFTAAVGPAGTGAFAGSGSVSVGDAPYTVVLGDVDNDGDLDLLTCNAGTGANTVSTRFNDGRGNFSGSQVNQVGTFPRNMVLGDLNGDGNLDYVVANFGNNTLETGLNNGRGLFISGVVVRNVSFPGNLALGDVDGDGDLDLLVCNASANTATVLLNGGSGNLGNAVPVPVGASPTSVALGDVDNDGDLDLLTANYSSNSVSVCRNNGTGSFGAASSAAVGTNPNHLALADLDGDNDLDLVTTNTGFNNSSVSVRYNDGTGTYTGTQDIILLTVPSSLALGDVDGDGDLDLLTGNTNSPTVAYLRLNDGLGNFTGSQSFSLGATPYSLALGDVDADGDLDLLASTSGNVVRVLLNSGTALAAAPASPGAALTLAPVPAHTQVSLSGALPNSYIAVLDALGRPVLAANADAQGSAQLRLPAGLAPGLYLVRCGAAVRRLVVE